MHIFLLVIAVILANLFLLLGYRRQKIAHLSDLLSRMGGVSFCIVYIYYLVHERLAMQIGFGSLLQVLSWINWTLVMGIILFFAAAYLFRSNPVVRARGLHETLFPLICAITPALPMVTPRMDFLPASWISVSYYSLNWKLAAFLLLVAGNIVTLIGFAYLGRAFSIMTQARHVVSGGIYRWIRHPVYVGESIVFVGVVLDTPSRLNLIMMIVWILAQRLRAHFEEQKLLAAFPHYTDYQRRTGAYFPKVF